MMTGAEKKLAAGKCFLAILGVVAAVTIVSCNKGQEEGRVVDHEPGVITITGSGTANPIVQELAERFRQKYPGISFNFLPSCHTAGGIEGTLEGVLDIGTLSRYLEDEEKGPSIKEYFFCKDALVFFTNQSVSLKNISKEQLIDIYQGKIRNWKKLGGGEGKILVLGRPEHSSGYLAVSSLLFNSPGFRYLPEIIIIERAGDIIPAVVDAKNSIGYSSLGKVLLDQSPVQILAIDGHYPDEDNIRSSTYPFYRPLGVVYRKNASAAVKEFIKYLHGEETRTILQERGYIPES